MKLNKQQYEAIVLVLENDGGFYRRYTSPKYDNTTMGKRRSIIGDACFSYSQYSQYGLPGFARYADIEDRDQLRRYFDDRYCIISDEDNKYAHIPSVWGDDSISEPLPPMNPALKPFIEKFVKHYTHAAWRISTARVRCETVISAAREFGYHCYCDKQYSQVAAAIEAAYDKQSKITRPKGPIVTVMYDLETGRIDHIDRLLSEIPTTTLTQPEDTAMNAPTILTVETRTFANGDDITKMSDSQVYDLIAQQEAAIDKLNEIKTKPKKLLEEIAKRQAGIAALVAHLDKAA